MLDKRTAPPFGKVELAGRIAENRERFEKLIQEWTNQAVTALRQELRDREQTLEVAIERASVEIRLAFLNVIVNDDSIRLLTQIPETSPPEPDGLRAFLRLAMPEFQVKPLPPIVQIRPFAAVTFSIAGAILGMLLIAPAVRFLLGLPGETGILVGGPVGAGLAIGALCYLTNNSAVLKWILATLVGLAAADSLLTIWDAVDPFLRMRRWFTGETPLARSWGKRLLIYVVLVVLLLIARAKPQSRADESLRLYEDAIRRWLNHAVDLMGVVVQLSQVSTTNTEPSQETDLPILETLVALKDHLARHDSEPDPEAVIVAAQAAVTAFETTFDRTPEVGATFVFEAPLIEAYKAFGVVEIGDPVRVMKSAETMNGRVVLRGIVARCNS